MIACSGIAGISIQTGRQTSFSQLVRENKRAVLLIFFATIAVETGFFLIVCRSRDEVSLPPFVALCLLWIGLISPCVMAGGRTPWCRMLRGGSVADASLVSFCLVWFWPGSSLHFPGVVKLYCISVSIVLFYCAFIVMQSSRLKRCVSATCLAGLISIILLSPLLVNSALERAGSENEQSFVATWAVRINPFFALCDAVCERDGFHWTSASWMYDHTSLGENVPRPYVPWYQNCSIFLALGIVTWSVAFGWRRMKQARLA